MPNAKGWIGKGSGHNMPLRPVSSHGQRKGGGGQGKRGDGRSGGRFAGGLAAWQALSMQDYTFLKKSHDRRIDKWSRQDNISWCMTLLLRHAHSYEHRPAKLEPDGTMSVANLLSFRMCRCLDADVSDIERVLAAEDPGKIRFVAQRDEFDELMCFAAAQGHSPHAQSMIDITQHLTRAFPGDSRWQDIMLNGTKRMHVGSILRNGLRAGGNKGRNHRAHIHAE